MHVQGTCDSKQQMPQKGSLGTRRPFLRSHFSSFHSRIQRPPGNTPLFYFSAFSNFLPLAWQTSAKSQRRYLSSNLTKTAQSVPVLFLILWHSWCCRGFKPWIGVKIYPSSTKTFPLIFRWQGRLISGTAQQFGCNNHRRGGQYRSYAGTSQNPGPGPVKEQTHSDFLFFSLLHPKYVLIKTQYIAIVYISASTFFCTLSCKIRRQSLINTDNNQEGTFYDSNSIWKVFPTMYCFTLIRGLTPAHNRCRNESEYSPLEERQQIHDWLIRVQRKARRDDSQAVALLYTPRLPPSGMSLLCPVPCPPLPPGSPLSSPAPDLEASCQVSEVRLSDSSHHQRVTGSHQPSKQEASFSQHVQSGPCTVHTFKCVSWQHGMKQTNKVPASPKAPPRPRT